MANEENAQIKNARKTYKEAFYESAAIAKTAIDHIEELILNYEIEKEAILSERDRAIDEMDCDFQGMRNYLEGKIDKIKKKIDYIQGALVIAQSTADGRNMEIIKSAIKMTEDILKI